MTVAILFVFFALLAKDVLPLGDRYVLRGLSEAVALAAAVAWFIRGGTVAQLLRYGPVWLYLGVLLLTVGVARDPEFVALQWLTLAGVLFALVAAIETDRLDAFHPNRTVLRALTAALTIVCGASVLLLAVNAGWAYEREESLLGTLRFKGVYGKAGQIAGTAGVLLGMGLFVPWRWWWRAAAVAVSVPCLVLSGTRGAWLAAIIGIVGTALVYRLVRWRWIAVGALLAVVATLAVVSAGARFPSDRLETFVRPDSIENLSGRLLVWQVAWHRLSDRPWLGYGFTAGSDAFEEGAGSIKTLVGGKSAGLDKASGVEKQVYSLHNGYIQAFLDAGWPGGFLYIGVIGLAVARYLARDRMRRFAAEWYVLVFSLIYNFTHSLVLGASAFDSVLAWYVILIGVGLGTGNRANRVDAEATHPARLSVRMRPSGRFPILMPGKAGLHVLAAVLLGGGCLGFWEGSPAFGADSRPTFAGKRAILDGDIELWTDVGRVDQRLARVKASGFNVYMPLVWTGRGITWPSRVAPWDPVLKAVDKTGFDPLRVAIAKAHALGVEVHPWVTVALRWNTSYFPEWGLPGVGEGPHAAFDIHNPNFRKFIVDVVTELVRQYDIDGVNLDFVRAIGLCQTPVCEQDYARQYGRTLALDAMVFRVTPTLVPTIVEFQRQAVTRVVREIVEAVRAVKPGLLISVDAHPELTDEPRFLLQGQDSIRWVNDGLVDVVMRMDYQPAIDVEASDSVRARLREPDRLTQLICNMTFGADARPGSEQVPRSGEWLAGTVELIQRRWPRTGVAVYFYKYLSDAQTQALARGPFGAHQPSPPSNLSITVF
jgi:O-antigen ligase